MFTKVKDGSVSIFFEETEVVTKSSILNTEINLITPLEPSVIPIASFDKEGNSIYVFKDEDGHKYFHDSSSNEDSLSPVMLVGASPQEDEIESEVDNSTLEQTTQPYVEFPLEAIPYFVGNSHQSFSFEKIPPSA
ncbi:hypothetical protein LIER_15435 [Lithospermum erythrorhizon]|uniref:Uncharacterized protein n=1 Tax=Lithospermum erythrorhizon TaxID=34254 RepID=A0AAV3Q632_LITER